MTLAVHVTQEGFQRAHPLGDASREEVPLHCAEQEWHQVERESPRLATLGEGDYSVEEGVRELFQSLEQILGS